MRTRLPQAQPPSQPLPQLLFAVSLQAEVSKKQWLGVGVMGGGRDGMGWDGAVKLTGQQMFLVLSQAEWT